jgi:hypothetical protein
MRYSALLLWLKYVNREPRVFAMMLGLLFGAILSPVTCIVAVALASQLVFIFDGETVQATIVSKHQAGLPTAGPKLSMASLFAHGKGGPRYVIRYEYTDAAGNQHTGEGFVADTFWKHVKLGDPVAVRYLRSDPARNQLASDIWACLPPLLMALLDLAILAGSIRYGSKGIRWVNRQVQLIRHGDAVPCRILRVEVEHRGKKGRDVVSVLEYAYAAPDLLTGKVEMQGKLPINWQTEDGIVILIDPSDPSNHAPDIFNARREDYYHLIGEDNCPY